MKLNLINYVDYKYSYAHALEPKLKSIRVKTFVDKKPVQYIRKMVIGIMNENNVRFTDKEQEFFDDILNAGSSSDIYYRVKNAINKAKETYVYVDNDGNLVCQQ